MELYQYIIIMVVLLIIALAIVKMNKKNIKLEFNNKCAYCGKEKPLSQEHFVALSKGGEFTINNIIPSCQNCNSSKRATDFFEWYPKFKHYSKKREQIILKFLNYNNTKEYVYIYQFIHIRIRFDAYLIFLLYFCF
mgnify:CR=1 FL=1